MNTQKIWIALAVVGSLILTACASTNPAPVTLNDTGWVLKTANGQSVLPNSLVTLNFENGKISGTDGCNSYSGSYSLNGDRFNVGKDLITTMMACPEPIMQQATAYVVLLKQTGTYKSDGEQLTLLDASGKSLATFIRQSGKLDGTSWVVMGYNNGKQAVVSVLAGSQLTADFGAAGKLSGSAGCNTYTTTYEVSGRSIKSSPAASTRKACTEPLGVMEQEAQFLKALETAATYRLDGNRLELRSADGALAVTFVALSARSPQTGTSMAQDLLNAEYPIEGIRAGKVQLKNGAYEEASAPGSATKTKVQLGKEQSFGDVNGDGAEDAVVTLVVDPGGSGTFTYLALVINEKGKARPSASVLLGDRIAVKSLAIQSGNIVVTMFTRKPDEPMSAEPKLEVTRTFQVRSDKLTEMK